LKLEALGDDRTRLSYEIEFSLMGKLGTLGYQAQSWGDVQEIRR